MSSALIFYLTLTAKEVYFEASRLECRSRGLRADPASDSKTIVGDCKAMLKIDENTFIPLMMLVV